MPLTDLTFPVTAKKIGPSDAALSRPKVFYLKSSDLLKLSADVRNSCAVLKIHDVERRKVELYETPDEFLCMQALSQGATGSGVFTKSYAALAPTSSATAGDGTVPSKYYNEISVSVAGNYVRLPDPFVRRLVVINNFTTGAIAVNARGGTAFINGVTGVYTIAAGERVHFVAPTASTAGTSAPWKSAVDVGA